jgi:hypothetical protein
MMLAIMVNGVETLPCETVPNLYIQLRSIAMIDIHRIKLEDISDSDSDSDYSQEKKRGTLCLSNAQEHARSDPQDQYWRLSTRHRAL